MFVAEPEITRDILDDAGLFAGIVDLLQMGRQFGDKLAKTYTAALFEVKEFLVDEHHGPDLADIAFEHVARGAVADHGQLQAKQAIKQLKIVLYPVVQLIDEG